MSQKDIERLLASSKSKMDPSEHESIQRFIDAYQTLSGLIDEKDMSIRKLRQILFGPTSEKSKNLPGVPDKKGSDNEEGGDKESGESGSNSSDDKDADDSDKNKGKNKKPPPKGHGRLGAKDYVGADRVAIPHDKLKSGALCPKDKCEGVVYLQKRPAVVIRITGQAPLGATVFELERYRCNLCGEVFTASLPKGTSEKKYDPSAVAMMALLKYGTGVPLYRLAGMQRSLGVPLPMSTQWQLVSEEVAAVEPVLAELIRFAAQARIFHTDDTGAKILALKKETPQELEKREGLPPDRTGTRTTGIVAIVGDLRLALYFTGRRHAGENLAQLLSYRICALPPPILMCDGLSHNEPKDFITILANCLVHGRRKFVDLLLDFPNECSYILQLIQEVYRVEAECVAQALSDEKRLRHHQEHSKPCMDELWKWCHKQISEKLIEPNTRLGKAIKYMIDRKEPLTLFLREPGAPIDNNIAERILKKEILLRKNSLFYRTRTGAAVSDFFMTLIHSTELNGGNPHHYLTELFKNPVAVAANPQAWMPWNYLEQCAIQHSV